MIELFTIEISRTKVCGFIHTTSCHDTDQSVKELVILPGYIVETLG